MRKLALAVCLMFALSPLALAQDKKETPKKTPTAAQKKQQERMKDCNEQAGAKKLEGDSRKKFMSSCLGGGSDKGGKVSARQEKMRACNKEASGKKFKGDERKKFMSECLKS